MQNNYEKRYYINNNNNEEDKKERVCKNCYGKVLRINNKILTIDLMKVKPSEIKIDDDDNNYSSSNTNTIIAATPPITSFAKFDDVVTNKKKRRRLSFEREKKRIQKIRNKRLTKTQRAVVNERNAIPFIENISLNNMVISRPLWSICSGQLMLLELSKYTKIQNCCAFMQKLL